jgi:hopene-associated glycosyltransferase HpnB
MLALVSLLSFALWIYLVAFRGRFWRSAPVLRAAVPSGEAAVAVIVPARNEAAGIRQSLASLLAQDYAGKLSIILVDDNSTDATAEIAASLPAAGHLTVLAGAPLPPGWSGKLWAVSQGLAHHTARTADYVLLTDADIVHAPNHISLLVAAAEADSLDLVSELVHLHCVTAAERAFIPAFVFFFQMLYPFAWVANPRKRTAGAAGGTMLVRRAALDRIDGVNLIRNALIDDCALAAQIKSACGRIWLGHAGLASSARVYPHWRDIWNMIARTAYEQLRHSLFVLLGCVAGMSILFLAPPLLAIFAHGLPRLLGLLAWLLIALAFQPTLHRYRRSPFWGILLPGISLFYLCATVASAIRHYAGRGGGWKDRVYPNHRVP